MVAINPEQLFQFLIGDNDIPWELIPESYLSSLIEKNNNLLSLPFFSLEEYQLTVCTEKHGRSREAGLWFEMHGIDFYLIDAKGHFDITSPLVTQQGGVSVIGGIYIGYTNTCLGIIRGLNEGDALLITHNHYIMRAGGYFQMMLEQTEDGTVITGVGVETQESLSTPQQTIFDSNKLSVRVDFLRHRRVYPLGELLALRPGDKLVLPETDSDPVILEIDGQRFAQGELVRVGTHFAVEIHQIFHKDA
ncbi:FliM/FliN family flagellar motor switch protein [Morganella psychrotolerans]|uniref:FliM/FliN family flagellar motor switch protein n=1 Tax=Morganella psychrotolerans TaxID=368603 RepID=UPI0039B01E6E